MKKLVTRLVLAISFMFTSIANANLILSLDPATQITTTGDIVSVTVMVDGLGDFVPLSLASFDIDIAFDFSALTFTGYSLFDGLGVIDILDPLADAEDWSWGEYAPGLVNISVFSYLSNFELWDYQPDSFALAELFFVADTSGTSAISFTYADLIDVNGDVINIVGVHDTSVTAVPAPATLILMFLGLLTMFVRQKYDSLASKRS